MGFNHIGANTLASWTLYEDTSTVIVASTITGTPKMIVTFNNNEPVPLPSILGDIHIRGSQTPSPIKIR